MVWSSFRARRHQTSMHAALAAALDERLEVLLTPAERTANCASPRRLHEHATRRVVGQAGFFGLAVCAWCFLWCFLAHGQVQ